MRRIERDRSKDRAILNKHFNGHPPYDPAKAEENGVWVNRSFLTGPRILAEARRQWNQAMMGEKNFFTVELDCGPAHKRDQWSLAITESINRELRRGGRMIEQIRSTGAGVVLHGIGPSAWRDAYDPIPDVLPLASLLVPGDTDLSLDNLPYCGIYREWTPHQLSSLMHGPKTDPGWNVTMGDKLVKTAFNEIEGGINANDIQYNPEKIVERMKQNSGFWNSDVAPSIKLWDFYFRDEEANGIHRKIVLDEDVGGSDGNAAAKRYAIPSKEQFLYESKVPYADDLSQVLHCQFGDCSAVPPFKYHSVRSLGWLIWGVTDLEDRFECRAVESLFENMMWFFRVAGQSDFGRIKEAVFHHIGVIPQGVSFIPAQERFVPNPNIISGARETFRQRIAETATSYTHDFDRGAGRTQLTATETMARVNATNAMVQGMFTLAYNYEDRKDREIARRYSLPNNKRADVMRARGRMLARGVPEKYIDIEAWDVQHSRAIGAGNKTVEMAAVGMLQQIRANLNPDAQRKVDYITVSSIDKPGLAEDLVPLDENPISNSTHDAEDSFPRLMMGLEFHQRPDMVAEDYVFAWLKDLMLVVQRALMTNEATVQMVVGVKNVEKEVTEFLKQMEQSKSEAPKVRAYSDALGQIMNHVKGIEQRLMEQQQAQGQNGNGQAGAEAAAAAAKVQGQVEINRIKAQNLQDSHAQKAAQHQAAFEMEQRRKDEEQAAELRRKQQQFAVDLQNQINEAMIEQERAHQELRTNALANLQDLHHTEQRAIAEKSSDSGE